MRFLFLCIPWVMMAQSYMATIEPFDTFSVYAQTSGQVVYLDKKDEMRSVKGVLIRLDDTLDKKTLHAYETQYALNLEKLAIMEKNYQKFLNITGKSQYEKDEKYLELLEVKQTLSTLEISIAELKDTLSKKVIDGQGLYIKSFEVNLRDYVSQGTKLATAYDISKAKVTVYVDKEDYKNIEQKRILLDGKEGLATLHKVDKTPDETFISAFKVELMLQSSDFGRAVSVEFAQ